MTLALLSDYCERKAIEFRCRAAAAYRGQNVGLGNECNDIAENLEKRAEYARPRLVTVVIPIQSQTSFGGMTHRGAGPLQFPHGAA